MCFKFLGTRKYVSIAVLCSLKLEHGILFFRMILLLLYYDIIIIWRLYQPYIYTHGYYHSNKITDIVSIITEMFNNEILEITL